MDRFIEEQQQHALNAAAYIKGEIYGEECRLEFKNTFFMSEHVLKKAFRPQRFTLLHDYISSQLLDDFDYSLRKTAPEIYDSIYQEFENFQTEYIKYENYSGSDYHRYLRETYKSNVHFPLVNSTFTILFRNRHLMRTFNLHVADEIKKLKLFYLPVYLRRDGVMKRCTYWPEWLKQGLLRREEGHCAICQENLTGVYVNNSGVAVDHIVPLNMGGANDPTNLQMLCGRCNGVKGGEKITTSNKYAPFWLPE